MCVIDRSTTYSRNCIRMFVSAGKMRRDAFHIAIGPTSSAASLPFTSDVFEQFSQLYFSATSRSLSIHRRCRFSDVETALNVSVEASLDHPFFVCGLGWSSCCPERTLRRYGLVCRRLAIGDTCVSLLRQRRQRAVPHRKGGYRVAAEETTRRAGPSPTSSAPGVGDRPSTMPAIGGASPPTLSAAATAWSSDHEPRTPDHRGMRPDRDNRIKSRELIEPRPSSNGRPRAQQSSRGQSPVDRDARSAATAGHRHRGCSDVASPAAFGRESTPFQSGSADNSNGVPHGRCQTRTKPTDSTNNVDQNIDDEQQRSIAGRKRRWSAPDETADDDDDDDDRLQDREDEDVDVRASSKSKELLNGRHKQRRSTAVPDANGGDDMQRTSPTYCRDTVTAVADHGHQYNETAQLDYCNNNNKEGNTLTVSTKMK